MRSSGKQLAGDNPGQVLMMIWKDQRRDSPGENIEAMLHEESVTKPRTHFQMFFQTCSTCQAGEKWAYVYVGSSKQTLNLPAARGAWLTLFGLQRPSTWES